MSVITEAPAASNAIDFTEPHSVVMPSSEEYRKTGVLPSKDDRARTEALKEPESPSANEDDSASSEPAAASEAAPTAEEQRRNQQSGRAQKEQRWQKRERELKEARAELARLKAQPRSESQQASQPAAQPETQTSEPQMEDVDAKTGQPKFATLNDYLKAHSKWNREEAVREIEQRNTQRQQETERAEIGKSLLEHITKAKQAHPDYDEVVNAVMEAKESDGRNPIFWTTGSHIDNFMLSQPDRGAGLMYHCCKNAGDPAIRGIFARTADGTRYQLSNMEQISRLAVLAHTLAASNGGTRRRVAAPEIEEPEIEDEGGEEGEEERFSARPISQAPRPPRQTSGKGSVGKDPVIEAVETGDSDTYMREVNRVALARRQKGKR